MIAICASNVIAMHQQCDIDHSNDSKRKKKQIYDSNATYVLRRSLPQRGPVLEMFPSTIQQKNKEK